MAGVGTARLDQQVPPGGPLLYLSGSDAERLRERPTLHPSPARLLHVLLITAYFPPDTGSAPQLFAELGETLVNRGHRVSVLTTMPNYHPQGDLEQYRGRFRVRETIEEMDVLRVAVPRLPRAVMTARGIWQFSIASAFTAALPALPRADVALIYSPPLPLAFVGELMHRFRGMPYVLNIQDLFPQSAVDLGALQSRLLIRSFRWMERRAYRVAPAITVHSNGNRRHVIDHGADPDAVRVLPNWVDTRSIRPGPKVNDFREEHGIPPNAFVASFAGIMGYSQDLSVILEAARILRDRGTQEEDRPIHWLLVGDGTEKGRYESQAAEMELHREVQFLPMQPRERYPAILHASDVGLATLHESVKTPVVPSKIVSIMAGGRPVVACMPLDGDAPRLIEEAGAGRCLAAGDAQALADTVAAMYADPSLAERMGRAGRTYAEERLSLEAAAREYEGLLTDLVSSRFAEDEVLVT